MTPAELLEDAFGRIHGTVHEVLGGLGSDDLSFRPGTDANTIGWLVWHLTRIQDDHVADVAGVEQVWTAAGWFDRFGLPLDPADTGYAHTADEVASVRVADPALLVGYFDAVHEQTIGYLGGLGESDLERVVDTRWDPPVTLAVRLVSVVSDDLQHAGQAAYVAGLLRSARRG